jgi:hypothetical protein
LNGYQIKIGKIHQMTSNVEKQLRKQEENHNIREYQKTIRTHLLTSRFNNHTKEENEKYRRKKWPNGCVYCSPDLINQKIPIDAKIIVLEMNNETNQIFGIGLLLNKPFFNKHSVYEDGNYNRYNYIGKYRIKREELTPKEEAVMKALDILSFTGNDHSKRGHGLKSFPTKLLMNCHKVFPITEYIESMFKTRFAENTTKTVKKI